MKMDELEREPSFALLGPGFSGGALTLLRELRRAAAGERARGARLVFAPYESSGDAPRVYTAAREDAPLEMLAGSASEAERAPLEIALESDGYAAAIAAIRESIAAGDVYQVNFTLRARLPALRGAQLAARLCRRGVPAFFAWVRFPEGDEFLSASPELFFALDGARVRCEPMKGTAAPEREAALEASGKDRAELAMITDLMRNDLVPVCADGSVRVACERRFLRLPYAVQAVSDVEGQLREGVGALEVLAALHPGGSITGAPKRAAMRAIAALERTPRGAYCGALGLVEELPGEARERARFSILIRTAQRDPIASGPLGARAWSYGVGGGIVWQSNADDELREIELKLGALR